MESITIKEYNIELDVEYEYQEAEPCVIHDGTGGGYPGSPVSVYINSIKHLGEDIHLLISDDVIDSINKIIISSKE